MAYLQNIPKEALDYGINKILTVRALSIDWKHRETEILIRNPKKFKNLYISKKKLHKIRCNKLRYIYHISRNVNEHKEFDLLQKSSDFAYEFTDYVYLDFDIFRETKALPKTKGKIILYSFKCKEEDMINFIVKYKTPIPNKIKQFKSHKHFVKKTSKNLSSVITKETNNKLLFSLWCCNTYIYNEDLLVRQFKTDSKIRTR